MAETNDKLPLPLSRPLPPGRRPRRLPLRLPDGYETGAYVYAPTGPERLPVVYLHGIQSHPGWFCGSAAALAERGHRVVQAIRRGSGDNVRARGHARSAGQLLDDVVAACRLALDEAGADRLHLVAVSWGGKLAAAFAANPTPSIDVASVTLVAPGIAPQVGLSGAAKLAVGLCLLLHPRRRFHIPLNDPALFTDNEAMRAYLRSDGFALHRATARLLFASRCLDVLLERAPDGAIAVPTTLLLARRDRIIDNARTRRLVERLTAGRAVVEEFDAAHVLEFEPDPEGFYRSLCAAVERGEQ